MLKMKKLDQLLSAICKPSQKIFCDENEATIAFIKNRFIFGVHFVIICIHLCSLPFNDLESDVNQIRSITQIILSCVFLIFCRSYPLVGQMINTLIMNLISLKIIHFHSDGVYNSAFLSFTLPYFVFYITQNVFMAAISSCFQFVFVITTIKENLIQTLSLIDPEIFAEKFATMFVAVSVPFHILNLFMLYRLNHKTEELSRETKRAEEALEQQKTFVYSFSHEMRNPMNSLLGNLDLALMSQQIAPEIKEMISTAKVCGVLLLNLINTVLDAGKLGLGKLEVNPVPTRVHDMFQRAWAISHDIITKKGLKSHLKISKQVPPRLVLDAHRLNQVLMNLIGNSIKFTEHGSITLSINWIQETEISDECFKPIPYDDESEGVFEKEYNMYAIRRRSSRCETGTEQSLILSGSVKEFSLEGVSQPRMEEKGVLKIIVRDTGCGMTTEDLSKLFQKFSQVGQAIHKKQIGTGLGLFISKEIIQNMKGQIRVYSKPKVGSTFAICIPTTALPMRQQSEQHLNVNDHLIPKLKSRGFKTIVADDSSFNVSLVCNFYSKIGVEVLATAKNGKLTYEMYLEIIKTTYIDIITLDIDMPILNGKEVCEKIRQHERKNNLRRSVVILISGNYDEEDMYNLLSKDNPNKADCFLKKPLVFEELCWAVYRYKCLPS